MLENRDYMLHLFVCNPLIIHVKAVIYQLRVRAAFEASPSPIIECVSRASSIHANTFSEQMNN